jgi:hypothetical protein
MLLLFIILTLSVPQQPREVVEAYEVCQKFQTLMAEDLDFDRAFEATFTKSRTRRREIAIAEGEFGNVDTARVDDALLIDAFKSRMQIFFLMMPLMSPEDKREEALFFPLRIKNVFNRKPPRAASRFRAYTLQLKLDAAACRAHLERLAKEYPFVVERIREFKKEALFTKLEPPNDIVKPLTAYSRGRVLGLNEPYYQIGNYAVVREGNEMRIIGIRFFTRLF